MNIILYKSGFYIGIVHNFTVAIISLSSILLMFTSSSSLVARVHYVLLLVIILIIVSMSFSAKATLLAVIFVKFYGIIHILKESA